MSERELKLYILKSRKDINSENFPLQIFPIYFSGGERNILGIYMKPFIKWAGGKSQLLSDIQQMYPNGLGTNIYKYCEPFVGGGAVLFDVLLKYNIKDVLINDVNKELINTYIQVKGNIDTLIERLEKYQIEFWAKTYDERKIYYQCKREHFNHLKYTNGSDKIEKAVLFIFLNRTCFNGLYRVNTSGLFNVPIGSYKKPLICDEDNLRSANRLLKNIKINNGDYESCTSFIDSSTFVYIDPPYRPLSSTSNFTAYNESVFDDSEQKRLALFVDKIHTIGAKVVLSNSDPKNSNPDDCFFDSLYNAYKIARISAKRMINSNSNGRGNINELLIKNY